MEVKMSRGVGIHGTHANADSSLLVSIDSNGQGHTPGTGRPAHHSASYQDCLHFFLRKTWLGTCNPGYYISHSLGLEGSEKDLQFVESLESCRHFNATEPKLKTFGD